MGLRSWPRRCPTPEDTLSGGASATTGPDTTADDDEEIPAVPPPPKPEHQQVSANTWTGLMPGEQESG
ncbi:hypothetical protein ACFW2V_09040 [Streptomyces sp. NPDC058947]|uniref:hypothetical protein n=1 Tax=Streptomyces sp. NPDC058947 TaxID=3346675 RepID=UPI0036ADEC6D